MFRINANFFDTEFSIIKAINSQLLRGFKNIAKTIIGNNKTGPSKVGARLKLEMRNVSQMLRVAFGNFFITFTVAKNIRRGDTCGVQKTCLFLLTSKKNLI